MLGVTKYDYYISRDGGLTYKTENMQVLYGTWFFLSEQVGVHRLVPYTILDLVTELGGFSVALYEISVFVAAYFGRKPILEKFIRKLYPFVVFV